MSTIDSRYCIVQVDPHTGVFRTVAAIRDTIDEANQYIENIPERFRKWYKVWCVSDIQTK